MGNKNYHYFVEGEDEKKLLSVLKTDMQLILPGKIEHFNIIQEKITKPRLMTIKSGTTIVLVFDTDVGDSKILNENIRFLEKQSTIKKVLCITQVKNLEDEFKRSCNIKQIKELTGSKSNKDFKADLIKEKNLSKKLSAKNFNFKNNTGERLAGFFHRHFQPVGIAGEHNQKIAGAEKNGLLSCAGIAIKVVPVLGEGQSVGVGDFHPLCTLGDYLDVQVLFVCFKEGFFLRHGFQVKLGDKQVFTVQQCFLRSGIFQKFGSQAVQRLVQFWMNSIILRFVLQLCDNHFITPCQKVKEQFVEIDRLTLHGTHGDALGEVLLEHQEHNDDGHGGQGTASHQQAEVDGVFALHGGNTQGNGQVLGGGQHNQLHEIVIPGVDEGEDGAGTHTGLNHGEHDIGEGSPLAGAVNAAGFRHFGGDAFCKLLQQEHAEGPAHDGEDNRPDGVVQVQGGHFTQQRDEDNLLGQRHGADNQGEDKGSAVEALLCQRVASHGGGQAGQQHGHHSHEHGVQQPADGSGTGGTGNAEQLEQGSGTLAHQVLVVVHHPLGGNPDRGGGDDFLLHLEGAGDNPVQGEDEQERKQAHNHPGGDGGGQLIALSSCNGICCSHISLPPYFSLPIRNWTAERIAMMIARITPMALPKPYLYCLKAL